MNRHCNGCTLCCKLIPVEELHKTAGTRCQHQRTGKGCAIYPKRPVSCREWACLWLIGTRRGGPMMIKRPDRAHYVLDSAPDLVRVRNDVTGEIESELLCMQVWVDPLYPDVWQDPELLDILEEDGVVALIRYGSDRGFAIFPPSRSSTGKWERSANNETSRAHDLEEARARARLEFWQQAAKEQIANDSTIETGGEPRRATGAARV